MIFPVDAVVRQLGEALTNATAAILVAEPGAGKTTRVPLALLDSTWLAGKKIVMLEPRRLAARAAAKRMAETLGQEIGETVGYTVRLDRKVSKATRIEVITEGVLTRRLQNDPELKDTGLVIFDEYHERSLDGDLGLALTLDMRSSLRDDLRVLVMSATLDAARLSAYLQNAHVINAPGRMFPVETRYLEKADRKTIATDAVKAIQVALRNTAQSILVFLPGESEIRRTEEMLHAGLLPPNVMVRPLFGAMGFTEQDAALKPAPAGSRKIVLATTIAETSLTIEGIGTVIDTGFKRSPRFDPASGMTSLETVRVSLASADQRRGRAGRLGPGVCYRLWPEAETRALLPHDEPEILVSDLAPLVLELSAWGVNEAAALSWLDAPPAAAFTQARDLLKKLEALDDGITAMGRAMVKVPLHPRLAHMVVKGNELGSGKAAAELAAFLSERGGQGRDAGSDIAMRLSDVRGPARERIHASTRQIEQILGLKADITSLNEGVLIAFAWPDRIAQRRGGERRYRLSGGGGAIVAEHDGLARNEWLAVATTDGASGDQKIFLAAPISRENIETYFGKQIEVSESVTWDSRSQSVNATRLRKLGALILEERVLTDANPEAMSLAMTKGIREMGLRVLPWTDAANKFRAQVMFLQRLLPEDGWPDLGDAALMESFETWLTPFLVGITRKAHLERLEMLVILKNLVPYELQRLIDVLAPRRIVVPSGNHITIDYETDGDPILRVRLQEMFGLAKTPTIARGRAQLRIELLSPAGRPLAVTKSLETFWTNGYPDVRAELRGRYPKHSWPEDPLTAPPVAPRRPR